MAYFDFNPFGTQAIIVRFECDKCSHEVESEEISVPSPDYLADTARDSQTDNEGYAVCENCGKEFQIDIYVTYADGGGNIYELPDDYNVDVEEIDEPYYEEFYELIASNTEFFKTFNDDLDNILKLLAIQPNKKDLKNLFNRQLYSSVISIMETYLSDAFINTVLKSKDNLKKFYKTFKGFNKQKIAMSAIFEFEDKAESVAKKAMLEVIYHNLPKVSEMYKDTFDVKFPKIDEIYKAVLKRHDFVHRNGKDKDGNIVIVDSEMINNLVKNVRTFITKIDNQIKEY